MIRRLGLFSTCFLLLSVLEIPAAGQAMVENALAAGNATGTATPARGLKNSMGGMFEILDKSLKSAQGETESKGRSSAFIRLDAPVTAEPPTTATTTRAEPSLGNMAPALPSPVYDDPATIQVGIGDEELRRHFGPPALEFTVGPSRKIVSYLRKGGVLQVELRDGKVVSAERPNR